MGSADRQSASRKEWTRRAYEWARAERLRAEQEHLRLVATWQQRLVDAEVRETRRLLLKDLRRRGGRDAAAFLDEDFLAVADQPTVIQAVLRAAVTAGRADFANLQLYDRRTKTLRMEGHHGFPAEFVDFFAVIGSQQAGCSCADALATREPVLVRDVTRSEVFAGQQSLEVIRAAGSLVAHSYPLLNAGGGSIGVLNFHYREPGPPCTGCGIVAAGAAQALSQLSSQ